MKELSWPDDVVNRNIRDGGLKTPPLSAAILWKGPNAAGSIASQSAATAWQAGPGQLAAVVHLVEVLTDGKEGEDGLTEQGRDAIAASRDYFRQGGQGVSFEQLVSGCGFSIDEIRRRSQPGS